MTSFKSLDGRHFMVSIADLQGSGFLKSMVDEHGDNSDGNDVPVLQLDSTTLVKVLGHCHLAGFLKDNSRTVWTIRPVPNVKTATIHSALDELAGQDAIEVVNDGTGLVIKKLRDCSQ